MNMHRFGRRAAGMAALAALAACSGAGTLGSVLGSVLGGGASGASGSNQVSGTVQGVDTRSQVIGLQASSGQSVNILYDNQTQVMFNNQRYPVTSLDRGDQVTARIQSTNGGYYTDLVQVDAPVQGAASAGGAVATGTVQTVDGTVRQVDQQKGLFALDVNGGSRVIVSMPYSASRADVNRFQNLRAGEYVRFAGVYLNGSRIELRQFY
ncbi:MAG TPA: hypothetical protein VL328_15335 [Gemmatimonadaceae bacterium]|jgi:hypothetical protein|nr:hypothetical protein [Gemmatimonadaceae bacterium]